MRRWLTLAVAALVCASAASAYEQTTDIPTDPGSGVKIQLNSPYQFSPQAGFVPVHVKITNERRDRNVWTFTFVDRALGQGSRGEYQETISVGPMQTRETYIFVPRAGLDTTNYAYQTVSGTVRGPGVSRGGFGLPATYRSGGHVTPFLLLSQSLAGDSWSKLETRLKSGINGVQVSNELSGGRIAASRSSNRGLRGSPVDLRELPDDERALSGVAGLILTDADWQALAPPMRKTIAHWVQGGGRLGVVLKKAGALTLAELPAFNGVDTRVPQGLGSVQFMHLLNGELPVDNAAAFAIELDTAANPAWEIDYTSHSWKLPAWAGWPRLNVPLVIGFVCIFAMVIGPINLKWLAPVNKRHRLFFTVPGLSALASVGLIAVIALGEGPGGIGGRNVILSLDSAGTRVNLLQEQVTRTRLLLGRDFKLDSRAQMAFMNPEARRNEGRVLSRAHGGAAGGDWFRSRSVQKHYLSAVIPSRAEVTVVKKAADGSGPTLLSSVPGTLRAVFYIDEEKRYWHAEELLTGRPTVLMPAQRVDYRNSLEACREPFSRNFNAVLDSSLDRPGHFYALAEASSEWPLATLASIDWQREMIFAFGPCTVKEAK